MSIKYIGEDNLCFYPGDYTPDGRQLKYPWQTLGPQQPNYETPNRTWRQEDLPIPLYTLLRMSGLCPQIQVGAQGHL